MKVGNLVQNKVNPQGVWLVTKIDSTGGWFTAHGYGRGSWLRINEYKVISTSHIKNKKPLDKTPSF